MKGEKREGLIFLGLVFVVTILSLSLVSAFSFSDFFGKITGKAVALDIPIGFNYTCSPDGTSVTLSWNAVSGASNYPIRIDKYPTSWDGTYWDNGGCTNSGGWSNGDYCQNGITTTSKTLAINGNTPYRAWIHSMNGDAWSGSSAITFNCTSQSLPVPTRFNYTCSPDGTSVTLSWDAVSGASNYPIRLDKYPISWDTNYWETMCAGSERWSNGDYCQNGITTTSKTLAINKNTPYRAWIHSMNGDAWSGAAEVSFTCTSSQSLPAPTTPTTPTDTSLLYNFGASTQLDCENSITARLGISGTCTLGGGCGVSCGMPSSTCVSANPTVWGACIQTATIGTPIDAPVGLNYNCSPDGTSVNLSWNSVSGASSYPVRLDKNPSLTSWNHNYWNNNGKCNNSGEWYNGDYCQNGITRTFKILIINPNIPYRFWVHSQNGDTWSIATEVSFNCTSASTTPTDTSLLYNFVAGSKLDCENSITARLGISGTCTLGGGCGVSCGIPSSTCVSANPTLWGACIQIATIDAPTRFNYTCSPGGANVNLSWNSVSDASGYSIRLDKNSTIWDGTYWDSGGCTNSGEWYNGDYCQNGITTTSKTLVISKNTPYRAWIHAMNGDIWSDAIEVSFNCTSSQSLLAPTRFNYTCSPDGTSVTLSWDTVSGASNYPIRLDKNSTIWENNYWDNGGCTSSGGWSNGDYCQNGITTTSKNLVISKNTPYRAWIHAMNGDIWSDTTEVNFTCNSGSESTEVVCSECELNGRCYSIGYRTLRQYCSEEKAFAIQFVDDSTCLNNFECSSNLCVSERCISSSLMQKIIEAIQRLFGA